MNKLMIILFIIILVYFRGSAQCSHYLSFNPSIVLPYHDDPVVEQEEHSLPLPTFLTERGARR